MELWRDNSLNGKRQMQSLESKKEWVDQFKSVVENYVEDQLIHAEPRLEKGFFKKFSSQVNWEGLAALYKSAIDSSVTLIRFRGPTLFATIALVNIAQMVAGYFLMKVGMGALSLAVLKIPVTIPVVILFDEAEKIAHRMKVYLQFGDADRRTLRRLLDLDKVAVEALDTDRISDLVAPLDPDTKLGLKIKKLGLYGMFKQFIGFDRSRMNQKRLTRFAEKHNIDTKGIRTIFNQGGAAKWKQESQWRQPISTIISTLQKLSISNFISIKTLFVSMAVFIMRMFIYGQ